MRNNRAQIGSTITWMGAAAIVFFIMALYLAGVFAIKARLGGLQRDIIYNKENGNDEILTINAANMARTGEYANEELLKRICENYYMMRYRPGANTGELVRGIFRGAGGNLEPQLKTFNLIYLVREGEGAGSYSGWARINFGTNTYCHYLWSTK